MQSNAMGHFYNNCKWMTLDHKSNLIPSVMQTKSNSISDKRLDDCIYEEEIRFLKHKMLYYIICFQKVYHTKYSMQIYFYRLIIQIHDTAVTDTLNTDTTYRYLIQMKNTDKKYRYIKYREIKTDT